MKLCQILGNFFHDLVFFEFFRVGMRPSTPRVKVRKCAELRKNMQLSYCKSDQHIKLFLWLHPCASISLAKNLEKDDKRMWKNSHSGSSKNDTTVSFSSENAWFCVFLPREKILTCLIDFYRPFKSGAHTRFLSTQNPEESAISSDLSKKQKYFLLHPSLFRGRGAFLQ